MNGVQTLSAQVQAVLSPPAELTTRAIARLRLSPHACDMVAVAQIYRALASGEIAPQEALVRLGGLDLPGTLVDGYARGAAGALAVASA